MDKVLIYKDQKKISAAKDFFIKSVKYVQAIYDKFRSYGIHLDVAPICEIISFLSLPDTPDLRLIQYLESMTPSRKLNVRLVTDIRLLITSRLPDGHSFYRIEANLMHISSGVISPNTEALTVIENRFCFYAESDLGAELGKMLFALSQQLNQVNEYLINKEIKTKYNEPVGIVFTGACYIPDISFIRDQERIITNTRKVSNTRTLKF